MESFLNDDVHNSKNRIVQKKSQIYKYKDASEILVLLKDKLTNLNMER